MQFDAFSDVEVKNLLALHLNRDEKYKISVKYFRDGSPDSGDGGVVELILTV